MENNHKKGKHLTLEERIEIYRLREAGYSGRAIAKKIKRHHSVINRELSRNSKPFSTEYKPIKAHQTSQHRARIQRQQAPLKNPEVFLHVRKKLSDKKAATKQKTFKMLQSVSKSRKPIIKTMTYDNGSENANHRKTTKILEIKSYFCHPYHSWEKGSVENVIGRVRRFIPKGTDLTTISEEYLQQVENWINNSPLKCLNWLTPNEATEQEVNKYKFRNYRKVLSQSGAFPL